MKKHLGVLSTWLVLWAVTLAVGFEYGVWYPAVSVGVSCAWVCILVGLVTVSTPGGGKWRD